MKTATLCLLLKKEGDKKGKISLAMKKSGFGVGRWNGYGGKVEAGESVEDAAVRELQEESGVIGKKEDLKNCGNIIFNFGGEPKMHVHFL